MKEHKNPLTAISPIDGRYDSKTSELVNYFSEFALMRYRLLVEIEYFIAFCTLIPGKVKMPVQDSQYGLRSIYKSLSLEDAIHIKNIERVTNHDVKAVEYFVKEKLKEHGYTGGTEMVHFGLTSQDINNTATPLMIKEAMQNSMLPAFEKVQNTLAALVDQWVDIPMLARTHGQPASPTTLGKEIAVFEERLSKQINKLAKLEFEGKFGGATGNFNAHYVAFPDVDWVDFANRFLDKLGLKRQQTTTQIEHYDWMAELFQILQRISNILVDLARDFWSYISLGYLIQKINPEEVGSSAMPHKVNPIDFENAEGNLGMANAIFEFMARKLPVSRLQRDLTDSTVSRNVGVPFGHLLIAVKSLENGLSKISADREAIAADLNNHWVVIAEAIQTILRREGYPKPYETLKELTRKNQEITEATIHDFISELDITDELKEELLAIRPDNYIGRFR